MVKKISKDRRSCSVCCERFDDCILICSYCINSCIPVFFNLQFSLPLFSLCIVKSSIAFIVLLLYNSTVYMLVVAQQLQIERRDD